MAHKLTDDLLTGNRQIDNEHTELIKAINNLLEACSAGKGRAEVEKTVKFLTSYTKTHFAHEEALQVKYNYPNYNSHKREHQQFIQTIEGVYQKFVSNGASIALVSEVNTKVTSWVINHIKKEDIKLAEYIRNKSK